MCQHCKQYGFECTFFLPITETRFKKKRLEEEAQAQAAQVAQQQQQPQLSTPADKVERSVEPEGSQKSPLPEGTRNMRIDGECNFDKATYVFEFGPARSDMADREDTARSRLV